jgi:hypothetical protein
MRLVRYRSRLSLGAPTLISPTGLVYQIKYTFQSIDYVPRWMVAKSSVSATPLCPIPGWACMPHALVPARLIFALSSAQPHMGGYRAANTIIDPEHMPLLHIHTQRHTFASCKLKAVNMKSPHSSKL